MSTPRSAEWDLVAAAQRGDREAFGQLYARYVGPVMRFVVSRVRNQALAEDLTSETFLRAFRRMDSVQDEGRYVGAWFTTIARNLIVDHTRSSRYRLERPTAELSDTPSQREGPEQAAITRDTAARLHRCVDRLPPDQQECVRLRFLHDLSVAETAARMGRSETAIKALTHRGIKALRATMTPTTGPVPPARERTPDPLLRARQAVEQLGPHRQARERQAVEEGRARELARWHTHDSDTQERHRERDAHAAPLSAGDVT
jgi:RNA polymerase sigma-70 factor (ECF subfamily)